MSNDSTNSCGWCCAHASEPKASENAPGLSALAYRLGTHGVFKAAMLAAIAEKPELAGLTARADDDPAIALLDGWAAVLDVLAFYQERIANEGYLRTATERRSVLELARGIGYELQPGVAASAHLAFTLETAKEAPHEAKIPKGAKVQSVPGQDEKPQLFETTEELEARAEWNTMLPRLRERRWPRFGDTQAALQGTVTNLKPGDALLFVGSERENNPYAENWDFRRIVRIEPVHTDKAEMDYTVVTWDRPLGKSAPHGPVAAEPKVFALRQRAALFGHNAPDWRSLPVQTQSNFFRGSGVTAEAIMNASQAGNASSFQATGDSGGKAHLARMAYINEPMVNQVAIDAPVQPDWPLQLYSWPEDWPDFTIFDIAGPGLFGEYFTNPDLTGGRQTRVDPEINFSGKDGLLPGTASACWTGLIRAPVAGLHSFEMTTPGECRLWIDGRLVPNDSARSQTNVSFEVKLSGDWQDFRLECGRLHGGATVQLKWSSSRLAPSHRLLELQLDAVHPKIQTGSWVVLSQPHYQELYRVEEAVEDAQSRFMLSTKTTRLMLSGEHLAFFNEQLRQAVVFGDSEELLLAEGPIVTPVFGQDLQIDQPVTALTKGRRLIITGRRVFARVKEAVVAEFVPDEGIPMSLKFGAGQTWRVAAPPVTTDAGTVNWRLVDDTGAPGVVVVNRNSLEWVEEKTTTIEAAEVHVATDLTAAKTITSIRLAEPLRHSYVRDSVRILGNVAPATHGETKSEVLGSGDASQPFQKFTLKQTPLTHVPAANANGAESTLEVRVNDILWREVPSLWEARPKDRCYVTRRAEDGRTTVEFGDGLTGARPPTGVENIRAKYRVGLGLAGVLKADQLSLLLTRPLGVKDVTNPLPSAGGGDPEPRAQARQNAPFTVRTLGRIVSLLDFEDFARMFAGIGKAQADWVWSGSRRVVFLTVAGAGGKALQDGLPPLTNLRDAIEAAREPTQLAQVGVWTALTFKLESKVLLEEGFLQDKVYTAVRAALLGAFSFERRAFGQGVTKSEVLAAIQGVEGIKAVDLDTLDFADSKVHPGPTPPLRASRARWSTAEGRILPAELLTLEASGIELKEMTA